MLKDGEQYKSMEELQKVWDKALTIRLDRGAPHAPSSALPGLTLPSALCSNKFYSLVQVQQCWH